MSPWAGKAVSAAGQAGVDCAALDGILSHGHRKACLFTHNVSIRFHILNIVLLICTCLKFSLEP